MDSPERIWAYFAGHELGTWTSDNEMCPDEQAEYILATVSDARVAAAKAEVVVEAEAVIAAILSFEGPRYWGGTYGGDAIEQIAEHVRRVLTDT